MNKQTVMALAAQAGFGGNLRNTMAVRIERFARLIAEACATLCDQQAEWADERDTYNPYGREMAEQLAAEIRMLFNAKE